MANSKRPTLPVWLRYPAGIAIAGLAVYLATRELDLPALRTALTGVRGPWMAAAVLVSFAGHAFKSFRWQVILEADGNAPSIGVLMKYILAGQFANLFIPGRAGDIGRAMLVGNMGAGKVYALSTVVLEKVLDLILYALLAALVIIQGPLPVEIDLTPQSMLAVSAFALTFLMVTVRYWDRLSPIILKVFGILPDNQRDKARVWITSAGRSLSAFRDNGRITAMMVWSLFFWISGWMTNELVLRAFGYELPLSASLLLLVVLQAGISTNLVPGTIGVFEYLCIVSLGLYGVSRELSLAYGVVLHVVVLFPLFLGALATIVSNRKSTVMSDL